jgi:hypothetical protein
MLRRRLLDGFDGHIAEDIAQILRNSNDDIM